LPKRELLLPTPRLPSPVKGTKEFIKGDVERRVQEVIAEPT
jgi:hypothetical protein